MDTMYIIIHVQQAILNNRFFQKKVLASEWDMAKQQEWYWNDEENENQNVETTIVLRLSENFNAAAMVISEKLGFKSLDDYVSDMVRTNVRMELEGIGHLEREHIEEIEKQMELIEKNRQMTNKEDKYNIMKQQSGWECMYYIY